MTLSLKVGCWSGEHKFGLRTLLLGSVELEGLGGGVGESKLGPVVEWGRC